MESRFDLAADVTGGRPGIKYKEMINSFTDKWSEYISKYYPENYSKHNSIDVFRYTTGGSDLTLSSLKFLKHTGGDGVFESEDESDSSDSSSDSSSEILGGNEDTFSKYYIIAGGEDDFDDEIGEITGAAAYATSVVDADDPFEVDGGASIRDAFRNVGSSLKNTATSAAANVAGTVRQAASTIATDAINTAQQTASTAIANAANTAQQVVNNAANTAQQTLGSAEYYNDDMHNNVVDSDEDPFD